MPGWIAGVYVDLGLMMMWWMWGKWVILLLLNQWQWKSLRAS